MGCWRVLGRHGGEPAACALHFGKVAMKYRKKTVVIEATQWFKHGDHPMVMKHFDSDMGYIDTLEGMHMVTPGDYIITGVKGERYPCRPDIFAMTYEEAE